MSSEENKALVRRLVDEVWSHGRLAVVDELIAPNYVYRATRVTIPLGPEGFKENLAPFRTGFPDARYTIDDMMAEGDKVMVRSHWTGTHQGDYRGIAPTGRTVTVTQINVFRIVDGKIAERWVEGDSLGMLQTIGAVTMTEPAPS